MTKTLLMPLAETPSPEGPTTLGYNPSLWTTVERDFGSPADQLAAALTDSRLVTLRGVDHFATTTDFRAMEAVLSFLDA